MKTTIKDLRQQGYKVKVLHNRITVNASLSSEISSKGGTTTIEVTVPDKSVTVIGKSVCSSEENFNKKLGNNIALGRALKQLNLNK